MTNSPTAIRLPAEWEPQDAVLIAWPHELTDWAYMLDEVQECFSRIAHAIARHSRLIVVAPDCTTARIALADIDSSIIDFHNINTNDTWARDFGPIITVSSDRHYFINDFKFNGWGLKFAANLDNMVTRALFGRGVFNADYRNELGFVLEGGSIESDGKGTIMTTSECLLSPNRNGNLSRDEIESKLRSALGAKSVLWLDHGALAGDDTDSHIDTLARFVSEDTIVYVRCDDTEDKHFNCLKDMEQQLQALRRSDGSPYNLVALPLPDPIYDEDGLRLPATYANFLILNDAVLIPVYGQQRKDFLAKQILKIVFPDHTIETVDCRALIRQHGSLHCVTMLIPKNSMTK